MRHTLTIALNDLLISAKERETFLLGLLMPAIMMWLLGMAMGGADTGPTITLDVLDEDGSALSARFVDLLTDEMTGEDESFAICPYRTATPDDCDLPDDIADTPGEWRSTADDRLEETTTYGTILIEPGFGDKLRAGEPVAVIFKNSEDLSAPTLAQQKIEAAISRMGGSVTIANLAVRVAEEDLDAFAPDSPERAAAFDTVLTDAETAWQQQPIAVRYTGTQEKPSQVGFNQSGPGIATMFVFIFVLSAASVLVYEREQGTLQRLYTLPVRKWQIIGGKLLGRYVFGVTQFVVLALVGAAMGVEWGDNLIGIALVMLIFPLTIAALGLALATVVRTSAQAGNIGMLMGLTLSPLGGAWWPMEIVPDFMKVIGHISPVAWAMDAFQEMMFHNGGVVDILPMLGALALMGALCFAFGVWNFKYE